MKIFAILACVASVAFATPNQWTLTELSDAIMSPSTDAAIKPVLEQALNIVMEQIFSGQQVESILISTHAGVAGTFDLAQLEYAIHHTTPLMKPYLEAALNDLMESLFAGESVATAVVHLPALDISYWTLNELDVALTSGNTDAALVPYLENALNELMSALFAGQSQAGIVVATPTQVALQPVPVHPIEAAPIATPAPVAPVVSSDSALVQIILNVAKNNNIMARN